MKKDDFISLIGKDLVVDYPFCGEVQQWSMLNFCVDGDGKIKHTRLPLNIDVFIKNATNPHKGVATHG